MFKLDIGFTVCGVLMYPKIQISKSGNAVRKNAGKKVRNPVTGKGPYSQSCNSQSYAIQVTLCVVQSCIIATYFESIQRLYLWTIISTWHVVFTIIRHQTVIHVCCLY